MKASIKKGTTNYSCIIFIQDSSSTTGAGLTGLVYNSAGLVCYYVRPGSAAAALTLATQTVTGAHSDGGFVEIDSTNMPGVYRLDLSDAIIATGIENVALILKGATNMAPLPIEIQLTDNTAKDVYDRIGAAGVSLTDLGGMSTGMKAEVNAEADTAISDAALATATNLATVDGVVDGIQTDLSNGTDGLGALKALIDTIDGIVDAILVDTADLQGNQGNWLTATGFSTHSAADVRTEMDANSVDLNSILTNLSTIIAYVDELESRLSAARAGYLDNLNGHTAQTGDSYARLGAPAGASISADIATVDTVVDGIQTDLSNGTDGLGALKTLIDAIQADLDNGTDGLGALKALIDTIDGIVDAILVDTGTSGVPLTAAAVDAILDEVVEGTLTMRQILRLALAALAGKSTGGGTGTVNFRDNADTKNRISATVDSDGNRTAVTTDAT